MDDQQLIHTAVQIYCNVQKSSGDHRAAAARVLKRILDIDPRSELATLAAALLAGALYLYRDSIPVSPKRGIDDPKWNDFDSMPITDRLLLATQTEGEVMSHDAKSILLQFYHIMSKRLRNNKSWTEVHQALQVYFPLDCTVKETEVNPYNRPISIRAANPTRPVVVMAAGATPQARQVAVTTGTFTPTYELLRHLTSEQLMRAFDIHDAFEAHATVARLTGNLDGHAEARTNFARYSAGRRFMLAGIIIMASNNLAAVDVMWRQPNVTLGDMRRTPQAYARIYRYARPVLGDVVDAKIEAFFTTNVIGLEPNALLVPQPKGIPLESLVFAD